MTRPRIAGGPLDPLFAQTPHGRVCEVAAMLQVARQTIGRWQRGEEVSPHYQLKINLIALARGIPPLFPTLEPLVKPPEPPQKPLENLGSFVKPELLAAAVLPPPPPPLGLAMSGATDHECIPDVSKLPVKGRGALRKVRGATKDAAKKTSHRKKKRGTDSKNTKNRKKRR